MDSNKAPICLVMEGIQHILQKCSWFFVKYVYRQNPEFLLPSMYSKRKQDWLVFTDYNLMNGKGLLLEYNYRQARPIVQEFFLAL